MGITGERVWQAWQRIQRFNGEPYESTLLSNAQDAVTEALFLRFLGEDHTYYTDEELLDVFTETLGEQDPGLAEDYLRNVKILGQLSGKLCDISFLVYSSDGMCYKTIEEARVLGCGLLDSVPVVRMASGMGIHPAITIDVEADQAVGPAFQVITRPESDRAQLTYSMHPVRNIRILN